MPVPVKVIAAWAPFALVKAESGLGKLNVEDVINMVDNRGLLMLTDWRTLVTVDRGLNPDMYDVALRPGTSPGAYARALGRARQPRPRCVGDGVQGAGVAFQNHAEIASLGQKDVIIDKPEEVQLGVEGAGLGIVLENAL